MLHDKKKKKKKLASTQKATFRATTQPSTPTPKYTLKRTETCMHEDLSVHIHGNIVCSDEAWKLPNVHQLMNRKLQMIHSHSRCLAVKRNKVLTRAAPQMALEKPTYCLIPSL